MAAHNDLLRFAADLEKVTDVPVLWAIMTDFYQSAGFGGISYILFSHEPGEVSMLLVDGFPAAITEAFMEMGCGKNDPNFRHALSSGLPSLRSRVADHTALTSEEIELVAALEKLNHADFLALPVFGPNNCQGIIALGLAERETFERASWTQLHLVALGAHLKCLSLRPTMEIERHNLSPREVEILGWVAQGKSNSVIAAILSIANTTVDTYLRRIFDKLGVADRTSAAVKGVSIGLIKV